jgi:hypothetical protein
MPQRITVLELSHRNGALRLATEDNVWHVDHWLFPTQGFRKCGPFDSHSEALASAEALVASWGLRVTSVA